MKATPGPIYDNALRLLARRDLVQVCAWLGLTADEASIHRAESLPAATHFVDLTTQIGPRQLAHVEFVRSPKPDMAQRMLEYRARIMTLHPRHRIVQHLVVLAEGTMPGEILDPPQLALRLNVTYMRRTDPERLLTSPSLATLATLGRARDLGERLEIFRRALNLIKTVGDESRRHDLLHTAVILAGIHLEAATIERLTREVGMPFTLDEDTVAGRSLLTRGEARGQSQERVRTMASLLHLSFGDDPRIDSLAARMADLPREQALQAALKATSLDDLANLVDQQLTPPQRS